VQAIAREVGIPTDAVRVAVRELHPPPPAPAPRAGALVPAAVPRLPVAPRGANVVSPWLGAAPVTWHERVVDGELDEGSRWMVVEGIRERLGMTGYASNVGAQLVWASGAPAGRDVRIAVTVHEGRTHIAARETNSGLLGSTLGGIGGGLGAVGSAFIAVLIARGLGSPEAIPFAVLGWLATTFTAARITFGIAARERQRQLAALVDELAVLVTGGDRALPRADDRG
jgi:hypothetical protein